jgi:hypothetical protein
MNLRDLLEEFFAELGYRKLGSEDRSATWKRPDPSWSIIFSKGDDGDLIEIRGTASSPFDIEIKYNCVWFEKINLNDPESLDYLKKALDIGKAAVDKLVEQSGSRYVSPY